MAVAEPCLKPALEPWRREMERMWRRRRESLRVSEEGEEPWGADEEEERCEEEAGEPAPEIRDEDGRERKVDKRDLAEYRLGEGYDVEEHDAEGQESLSNLERWNGDRIQEGKVSKLEKEEQISDKGRERIKRKDKVVEKEFLKICSKDNYANELFQTLEEFRDSSLLTDLTLSTEDGLRFQVHSPVLASVSSLIHHSLEQRDAEWEKRGGPVNMDTQRKVSMVLAPGVDRVGLAGVLEFAYTGVIAALNTDNVVQIQTAAEVLGVPRVLELCRKKEEQMIIGRQEKTEERKISAGEQMKISLQSISQLWTQRVGCDIVLEVEGTLCPTHFYAHRVILAASSDYFRAMFTCGMKESQQYCVTLPFLVASELEILIGHSYSGSLPLSWGRVFEISCTALQLQFQATFSLCLNFLRQEMDAQSCLDVASFAEAYGMMELFDAAEDFVLRNFQKVAANAKFRDLPVEKLMKFLRSPSLCARSELVVFKAVVSWIEANPETSPHLAKELMENIKFNLMTFVEFKEVQDMTMWKRGKSDLFKFVQREFSSSRFAPRTHYRVYFPKDSLVLVGGDQISEDFNHHTPSRDVWFGNSLRNHIGKVKNVEWRKLVEIPESPRLSHEVAVLGGKLYVAGGKTFYRLSDTLNSVFRYDPTVDRWQRLADMQKARCCFSMVAVDGAIYAIGGDVVDAETSLDSVERYCPGTDSWNFAQALDQPLSGHAASVLNGEIFISGGFNVNHQCLLSMFLYHPERGTIYLADMNKPRALHCMENVDGNLYIAGGVTANDNSVVLDQLSCEVYNPARDTWSSIAPLTIPHVGPASAVLEGKLYVLGGYCQEDYRESKLVHRYDPSSQRWENMGRMPGPNTDIRACVLHLPQHLRL